MPRFPTEQASVGLNPGSTPQVRTGAEAIGAGMQSLGQGLSEAAIGLHHFEKNQASAQAFDLNQRHDLLREQIQTAWQDYQKTAPANGTGVKDGFMAVVKPLQDSFMNDVPANLKPQYQVRMAVDAEQAGQTASAGEFKLRQNWDNQQIGENISKAQGRLAADPSQQSYDTAMADLDHSIDLAPSLTPQQREFMKKGAREAAQTARAQGLFPTREAMSQAMGIPTAQSRANANGSPDATWQAMLQKENVTGDPAAKSSAGALGIAQVLPGTARDMAKKLGIPGLDQMSDQQLHSYFAAHPDVNHQIGRAYFDEQLAKYGGDQAAAVIAYNAGPVRADKWIAAGRNDAVLPKETQDYKAAVLSKSGADAEEEAPENMPDASSSVPNNAKPDTIGLGRYLVAGKGMEHINGMQKPLQQGLQAMFDAAPPEIQQTLRIMSGYRSPERQQQLWDAALKKYGSADAARKWVAPPGNSQHNHGNAADLSFDGAGTTAKLSSAGQAAMQWVHANAGQFGLTFPLGNEPWHVEVAGARGKGGAANVPVSPTGVPVGGDPRFSDIPFDKRQGLVNWAGAQESQNEAIARGNLEPRVQDATASLMTNGRYSGTMPTQGEFVAAYGAQEGSQRYIQFRQIQQVGEQIDGFKSMSPDQIQATVAASRPVGDGPGFAAQQSQYEAVQKAAATTLKMRQEDPAGYIKSTNPQVASLWQSANTPDGYRTALAAMAAAQSKIGIAPQNQKLLPDDFAKQTLDSYKNDALTVQQRMAPVLGAILRTNNPDQQKAIFGQLVKAGLPTTMTGAIEAYSRGDQGAGDRLMSAVMLDPGKLPTDGAVKTADINTAVAAIMAPGQIGNMAYGLQNGNPDNVGRAQDGMEILKRSAQLRIAQGETDATKAVKDAAQDLFGKQRAYSNTFGGMNFSAIIPDGADLGSLSRGMIAMRPQIEAAAANAATQFVREKNIAKGNPTTEAVMAADIKAQTANVMNGGQIINYGRDGFAFLDPYTNKFVPGADGKPLVFKLGDFEAADKAAQAQPQQSQGAPWFLGGAGQTGMNFLPPQAQPPAQTQAPSIPQAKPPAGSMPTSGNDAFQKAKEQFGTENIGGPM